MTNIQRTKKAVEARRLAAEARNAEHAKRSPQAQLLLIKDRPGKSKRELAKIQKRLDAGPEFVLVA